jgi:hypothetical protein
MNSKIDTLASVQKVFKKTNQKEISENKFINSYISINNENIVY